MTARRVRLYEVATVIFFVIAVMYIYREPLAEHAWEYSHVPFLAKVSSDSEFLVRAASYHMDAQSGRTYDLDVAESLLKKAVAFDADAPYVFHQLARIAFLRGDFGKALSYINTEISHGDASPSSYYVRGLIEGFMGDYAAAANDYEVFLRADGTNWAAINDYAWVLLKSGRYRDALVSLDWGLSTWPENPWLHNSRATALFELGRAEEALAAAQEADRLVANISEKDWLQAYPGNDPLIAESGVEAFKKAIQENMHSIELVIKNGAKPVQ